MKKHEHPEIAYMTILDEIPSGFLRLAVGKKVKVVFANNVLCRMVGHSREEISTIDPPALFSNKRTYDAVFKKVLDSKELRNKKIFLKGRDGVKVSTTVSGFLIKGSSTRQRYLDFIFSAAENSLNKEKDLANSKELFKTIFNSSPVAIIVTDKQQHVIAWNPFAQKMLEMGWNELFNRPLGSFFPSDEWERIKASREKKKGVVADLETKILAKKEESLDISLSLSPINNAEGDVIGSIGIMHDVSTEKKVRNMLLEAKKTAETASQAKTMFLANMSHEVRTPMNTILGMVDLTLDTELTPEQHDNLLTVKNAADILLSLLNDILDLSRVEAGKIQLESIEINIEHIVQSVCKTMDILARNKGLTLRWIIDEQVPDMVKGDPVRLRQILVNLINNAIKFTKDGKIQVEVKVKSQKDDHCEIQFSVMDEGIGIEKGKQNAIFDVFTQEDVSTTRQFGGTGLGLAICKKLLELMSGRIWLDSEKGKGSTFYFVIPYTVVQQDEVPEALQGESIEAQLLAQIAKKKKAEEGGVKKEDLYILLAEDNLVNQKMTQRILEKKSWRVAVANNGQEVLDMMQNERFDLILMDAQMPVMDGLESTREIRKREEGKDQRIPIVALTARAMSGDRKKCLEAGMDAYVSKPIERDQLFETVQSFFT